jgi:protein-tyrosine phosphatase
MATETPAPAPPADDPQRAAMRAATKRIDRVNDWLLVGGAIPAAEYQRFRDAGITHVVDLREDAEVDADPKRLEELGIARRQIPVPNHGAPTGDQLAELAKWFDAKTAGGKVYVHCGGGFGRAATMAVGLLVLQGASVDDAVREVRQARPEIRLNADQLAWLRGIDERGSGKGT